MPKQAGKRPHESMTTHEAMEHLLTPEGVEHIKRAIREHNTQGDLPDQDKDSNQHRTSQVHTGGVRCVEYVIP
jgi:hypothetical protein